MEAATRKMRNYALRRPITFDPDGTRRDLSSPRNGYFDKIDNNSTPKHVLGILTSVG